MANANSDNPRVGKSFQAQVKRALSKQFGFVLYDEVAIPIGTPPKEHKYDLANADRSVVVECKCYTWTETGNVPSAKLMGLDEAVFYFGFLPAETRKIICMARAVHPKHTETLAEYYVRQHGHLLDKVEIYEIENEKVRIIR